MCDDRWNIQLICYVCTLHIYILRKIYGRRSNEMDVAYRVFIQITRSVWYIWKRNSWRNETTRNEYIWKSKLDSQDKEEVLFNFYRRADVVQLVNKTSDLTFFCVRHEHDHPRHSGNCITPEYKGSATISFACITKLDIARAMASLTDL